MSEHETETDTEATTNDRFTPLFHVSKKRQDKLFAQANLKLMAVLKLTNKARYIRLTSHLRAEGMTTVKLRELEADVGKVAKVMEAVARSPNPVDTGDDDTPLAIARRFRDQVNPNLVWYQSEWLTYRGSHYDTIEIDAIRRDIYRLIESIGGSPNAREVSDVVDALKAMSLVERGTYTPPCWLDSDDREAEYPAKDILACRNGLLHLPTGTLLEPTPSFFTRNGLSYDYNADAPQPTTWLRFLDDVWGHDREQITLLQEVFGYLLTPDTSRQKFFLLLGVKRGGKGTIIRTMSRLLGSTSICSPTLASMGSRFGLETTLGKSLATISDMRLSSRTDKQEVLQNILRIVGEDDVDVERKHVGGAWTGKLNIRIFIAGNKAPTIPDESGALVSRLITLKLTESFLGKEDFALADKLVPELAGILNWSVEGWRRLKAQGQFTVTAASRSAAESIAEVAAPLSTFLAECCEMEPSARVTKDAVWNAYLMFSASKGIPAVYSSSVHFHMALESAAQFRITAHRLREGGGDPVPHWVGMRLVAAVAEDMEPAM